VGEGIGKEESLAKRIYIAQQAVRIRDRDTNSPEDGRERCFVASDARQAEASKTGRLKTVCDLLSQLERQSG
jgi:hypothetical protein